MRTAVIYVLWYLFFFYYLEKVADIQKGKTKRIVLFLLTIAVLSLSFWLPGLLVWPVIAVFFLLFAMFYEEKFVPAQFLRILLPGLLLAGMSALPVRQMYAANGLWLAVIYLLLTSKKGHFHPVSAVSMAVMQGMLSAAVLFWGEKWQLAAVLMEYLLFWTVEGTLLYYQTRYEKNTEAMQRELIGQQYEEIRHIYLDMRGWRHDYHNHLQVLKVQLAQEQFSEAREYLDKLEQNLEQVDTYVKSGNQMTDAILNSKLSLANARRIRVNCKVRLPEVLEIDDVDMCVILGNLLDNAIEACERVPEEERFLRVYIAVNKKQLYISVQNAAEEVLDFEARHYISTKRGNHGLGMKRVQTMVEKYDGYLHLANEAGIFAAEVTMPLRDIPVG